MLTGWGPFGDLRSELHRLHDEMNRMLGRYGNGARAFGLSAFPPLNLWEDEVHLYVEAELPGFSLDDMEIYVTGEDQLNVKGERKPPDLGKGTWHRQERGYGAFSRLIELPGAVDSQQVSAKFEHGVLTITLPKKEAARPRKIEVKAN